MSLGAVHESATWALPAVPVTPVGGPGTVRGVTDADAVDALPVPATLVAVTVKVYAVPLVSPVTVHDVVDDVQVRPPGDAVAVYPVIAEPPLSLGAVHDSETCVLPGVPATPVGAPGTVRGVTEEEAGEALLVPALFVAVTVNV